MLKFSPIPIVMAATLLTSTVVLILWLEKSAPEQESGISLSTPITRVPASTPESMQRDVAQTSSIPESMSSVKKANQPAAKPEGVAIRGWVGNVSGDGLTGIKVRVENRGFDGAAIATVTAISDNIGEFLLENIVPGRQYKLEIEPAQGYAGYSLDSFSLSKADMLSNITLGAVNLVDVDGMIVDTNLAPVANFELTVRSLSAEFPDRNIRSDATGYFSLKAFPAGELRIATNASDYFRIKGLILQPDEYRNLNIMIDKGNYHLSGWLSDDNGAPLEQAQVTLKSAFTVDGYHSFSYRTTVTDSSGAFEFSELGGNNSTLGIYANGFTTYIQQHEFQSFSDTVEIRLSK